jgi:uncharacterized membrane protein YtjA (UPF0391 family)
MATTWMLSLGLIFLIIAIILIVLGFIGRVAWKIGKWLIILCILLALLTWVSSLL